MFQKPLDFLERLNKYGVIDILFGLGIFSYLRKRLRRRSVSSIFLVDIKPRFDQENAWFAVEVQNNSTKPLYIYRCCFKPGYLSSEVVKGQPSTRFLKHWAKDKFPAIHDTENPNTEGQYVIWPVDDTGNVLSSAFLEPRDSAYYRLRLKPDSDFGHTRAILEEHQTGMLELHLIHGDEQYILERQL